jgi:CRISPR/Cas system Type II protein with McrA/HNH and RuvC-like nuclease domain
MSLNTNYGRPGCKDSVWKKGKIIKDMDPTEFRICKMSNSIIRYSHYGDNSSIHNWDIDHIIPKSRNGSDDISNLQPVSSSKNRSIGNSIKNKPHVMEKMFEEIRIQRVEQRDGLTRQQILDRMQKQLPESERIARSQYILNNDGIEDIATQVNQLISQLQTRFGS